MQDDVVDLGGRPDSDAGVVRFSDSLALGRASGLGNLTKGGVPGPDAPKMQALPEWGGGSDPCLDFCEGFVHMH